MIILLSSSRKERISNCEDFHRDSSALKMLWATTGGLVRNIKLKSVRSLLVVICGSKITKGYHLGKTVQDDSNQAAIQLQNRHVNVHNLLDGRINSDQLQLEFADLETAGYLEVVFAFYVNTFCFWKVNDCQEELLLFVSSFSIVTVHEYRF